MKKTATTTHKYTDNRIINLKKKMRKMNYDYFIT